MKQFFFRLQLRVAVLLLLLSTAIRGYSQDALPLRNRTVQSFQCYPNAGDVDAATKRQAHRTATTYNPYGEAITPRGELRVLIIYAGFTNDINANAPGYNGGTWPQNDGVRPVGQSFPANAGGGFYTSASQFSSSATDKTLSNFYYQMSQFSSKPLKMYATVFPKRINVTADDITSASGGYMTYTSQVMTALQSDPDTQRFDFSQVDKRAGTPNFQFDNSGLSADNIVDYTIIVWRNPGAAPYGLSNVPEYGGGGWASVPYTTNIASADGQSYTVANGFTHTMGMEGVNPPLFAHEFAHTFYSSPHYFGANGVVGQYFNSTEGPGMMGYFRTFFAANSWERWFNGWAELQASGVSTDIQDANSLTASGGVYTLRDYITTGDMMRIKLPGSSQYLWLENHLGRSVFDQRITDIMDGQTPSQPFASPPRGLIAMLEDASSDRSQPLSAFGDQGVNGLKMLSAQGNYDYSHSNSTSAYNNHFYGIQLYNFTNPVANPFGGESQISRHRFDADGDGQIVWNPTQGNSGGPRNEQQFSMILNGQFEDGLLGPDIGFSMAGQKMGISYNPAIFEHQHYDSDAAQLSTINLNGLSVEVLGTSRKTGALVIQVRYDDVEVVRDTRWTGNLTMTDVISGAGADVHVVGATLTIDKSGTVNRHTKTSAGEFINATHFMCAAGTTLVQEPSSTGRSSAVVLAGDNTWFQSAGKVQLNGRKSTFVVGNGALLDLTANSTYVLNDSSRLLVQAGGTLLIHRQAIIQGNGRIEVQAGGYICVEDGAVWQTAANFTLSVDRRAFIGTNGSLDPQPIVQRCASVLNNYCSVLTGGNPYLTASCILERPAASTYSVTPNPTTDQITVATGQARTGTVRLSIQDMQGHIRQPARDYKLVEGQALRLSVRELPAGLYLLVVEDEAGRHTTRLEVNH